MFWQRRKSFTRMLNPCYELIAQGYGIGYEAVTDRSSLHDAVGRMLAADGPYLLECAVRKEENVLPMIIPGKSVDEMSLELEI
jgi:acetolactate synthase-1/2/3 large subunit